MTDLSTIRAEIKNWERSFKQNKNRPPTVDDIKKDSVIADRYKQYKKLSKALVPSNTTLTVKSTASLSTPPRTTRPKDPPSKIQPSSSPSSSVFSLNPPQMPAGAVFRARKRLRGEPVSPSPNKDKKRRVIPTTAITFPRLNLNAADSDDEQHNTDTSFVDNSPLKAPFSGKSFSRLFEESATSLDANRSTKRPFSDDEPPANIPRTRSPLLPPSPPPTNTSGRPSAKPLQHKGNSKTNKGRKKMKIDEKPDNHDSDDLEPTATLRIVHRKTTRPLHPVEGMDDFKLDSDPIIGYTRFPALHPSSPITDKLHHGSIEIDLPDKLRSVLALRSSASKAQVSEEDQLVKGLLYGRRVTHYDPNKGGEIWDVGEDNLGSLDEDRNRYTDGEDEWECEPVPWEVGEL